jgi:hypothetical protein
LPGDFKTEPSPAKPATTFLYNMQIILNQTYKLFGISERIIASYSTRRLVDYHVMSQKRLAKHPCIAAEQQDIPPLQAHPAPLPAVA